MASIRSSSNRPKQQQQTIIRTSSPPPPSYNNNNNTTTNSIQFPIDKYSKSLFPSNTIETELPRSRRKNKGAGGGGVTKSRNGSASESGASTISRWTSKQEEEEIIEERKLDKTNSPIRISLTWLRLSGKTNWSMILVVVITVWIKWTIGLGGYSGLGTPPMRGDFEAQRHWLALTSSAVDLPFLQPISTSIPISEWYSHDLSYWGLDYPPLTAYHSLFLGTIARLSSRTSNYVTLRPVTSSTKEILEEWDLNMEKAEKEGGMKTFMRSTVVLSDLFIWVSAVVVFCKRNYSRGSTKEKRNQTIAVAAMSILLQPGLLLIDNGHFQYNSVMLGLTLWSVNLFQASHDLLGAGMFVCALCFKQMSLYYSPAIFAYLLGKCLYLGGRAGFSHLLNIAFLTLFTFFLLFSPFILLSPFPSTLFQSLHRIFPFARGLFEDKVANFWCVLNIVIKFQSVASIGGLAKAALGLTVLAILPSTIGVIWVSSVIGKRERVVKELLGSNSSTTTTTSTKEKEKEKDILEEIELIKFGPAPTIVLLPHALFISSMAFFLFSFQVHEKSILLPLMPLTMLIGTREIGQGRFDWEWAVLLNNVGVFSMWPLLKKDGLGVQYLFLTLFWNFIIGYNPLKLERSFVKYLSLISYFAILFLHTLELVASPPSHLPDLFPVLNLIVSAGVFSLGFLWASKRSLQESWAVVGMSSDLGPISKKDRNSRSHSSKYSNRGTTTSSSQIGEKETKLERDLRREERRRNRQTSNTTGTSQIGSTIPIAPPSIISNSSSRISHTGNGNGGNNQHLSASRYQSQQTSTLLQPPSSFSQSQSQSKARSTTSSSHHQQPSSQSQSQSLSQGGYRRSSTTGGGSILGDSGLGHGNPGIPRNRLRVESVLGDNNNNIRRSSVAGSVRRHNEDGFK